MSDLELMKAALSEMRKAVRTAWKRDEAGTVGHVAAANAYLASLSKPPRTPESPPA